MEPMPTTIFFMTDGRCGESRGIGPLIDMVCQLNAQGKTVPVIHTVGLDIGLDVGASKHLEQIAGLTGGECRFLEAKDYIKQNGTNSEHLRVKNKSGPIWGKIEKVAPDAYPLKFEIK